MKSRLVLFLSLSTSLFLSSLSAQSIVAPTLNEPIRQAIANNAKLELKRADSEITRLEEAQLRGRLTPQVDVIGGYGFLFSRMNNEFLRIIYLFPKSQFLTTHLFQI